MAYIAVVLVCAALLAVAAFPAKATSPAPSLQLEVVQILETAEPEDVIDATVDPSLVEEAREPLITPLELLEPSAPDQAWGEQTASGVALPLTEQISLGLDYELEELEELTNEHIEMGSASADHESHNVMLRARWHFDVQP